MQLEYDFPIKRGSGHFDQFTLCISIWFVWKYFTHASRHWLNQTSHANVKHWSQSAYTMWVFCLALNIIWTSHQTALRSTWNVIAHRTKQRCNVHQISVHSALKTSLPRIKDHLYIASNSITQYMKCHSTVHQIQLHFASNIFVHRIKYHLCQCMSPLDRRVGWTNMQVSFEWIHQIHNIRLLISVECINA